MLNTIIIIIIIIIIITVQIPPLPKPKYCSMPHTKIHSGDQMPPPQGHFTGTREWQKDH